MHDYGLIRYSRPGNNHFIIVINRYRIVINGTIVINPKFNIGMIYSQGFE